MAVAAGVSQLAADEQIAARSRTPLVPVFALEFVEQQREIAQRAFVNPKLPRVGAGFVENRDGFAPDQFAAAVAEAFPAAKCQFAGAAVEFAVATFHGMNGEAVAHFAPADFDRLQKAREIGIDFDDAADAQRDCGGAEVSRCFIIEPLWHGALLSVGLSSFIIKGLRGQRTNPLPSFVSNVPFFPLEKKSFLS